MNKGDNTNIYLVKYEMIHNMVALGASKKLTYNLYAFINLEDAKSYMNTAYKTIVEPLVLNNKFKIIIDTSDEKDLEDNIICKRTTKIIGNTENNYTQTKLFVFTVEELKLKL